MAKYSFSLSTKTDPAGKHQVMVRASFSRDVRLRFKSGVWILPNYFNDETGEIIPPKRGRLNVLEVSEVNKAKNDLQAYISRIGSVYNAMVKIGKSIDGNSFDEVMRITENLSPDNINEYSIDIETEKTRQRQMEEERLANKKTFFGLMLYYTEEKKLSERRKRGYKVLIRQMQRYEAFVKETDPERKQFALGIDSLDKETLDDFFDYMRNEHELSLEYKDLFQRLLTDYPAEISPKHIKAEIQERGLNTIVKSANMLRAFCKWCIEEKHTINNPFSEFRIGKKLGSEKYGTPYYLTLEERNAIADYDLKGNKHLEQQRDIFIFQCLIGCRVSDLLKLTDANIINGAVEYIPRKTMDERPITVRVPLNDRAKALVEKYKGYDRKGRLMPFISSQKYNEAIKDVLTKCEINRKVTVINSVTGKEEQRPINEIASSHMARRTFIGNIYKKVKDPNLIGVLSGHAEGSRAFTRYRDIDEDTKKETVKLID